MKPLLHFRSLEWDSDRRRLPTRERSLALCAREVGRVFVVEELSPRAQPEIVALIAVVRLTPSNPEHGHHIEFVYVRDDKRRQGFGEFAVVRLRQMLAAEVPGSVVTWLVDERNKRAQQFCATKFAVRPLGPSPDRPGFLEYTFDLPDRRCGVPVRETL